MPEWYANKVWINFYIILLFGYYNYLPLAYKTKGTS